jgi:hypothetical protein
MAIPIVAWILLAYVTASCSSSTAPPGGDGGNPDAAPSCGDMGEICCNGTSCGAGLTCGGGVCE